MIKKVKVTNLNGSINIDHACKSVNLICGINGKGKTTLIKLIWYVVSSNLERVFDDMTFDSLTIATTDYEVTISLDDKDKISVDCIFASIGCFKGKENFVLKNIPMNRYAHLVEPLNKTLFISPITTVFFPTFRRIEGGFGNPKMKRISESSNMDIMHIYSNISESLNALSRRLGVLQHKFVCSLSISDVRALLVDAYALASKSTNKIHEKLALDINSVISSDDVYGNDSEKLTVIKDLVREATIQQGGHLKPIAGVDLLIKDILKKNIKFSDAIRLGDLSLPETDADSLSSGEKQMVSFLAYNSFLNNGCIFIDEPELSLHGDWQRKLIPYLVNQNKGNQFFFATHSPFIYTGMEQFEVILN